MNESIKEPIVKKKSLRKQLGKALFWIGFIIIVVSLIPSIATAVGTPSTGYELISNLIGPGLVLAFIGLLAALYPEGQSEDGTWIMMMSPFAGNN